MFCVSRIQVFRSWGIFISKSSWNRITTEKNSIFPEVNVELAVQKLRTEGLFIGLDLPQDLLLKIQEFSLVAKYFGNANNDFSFFLTEKEQAEVKYQQKFITAHNFNPALRCSAIKKIEQDPKIWEIAAKYLETNPVLIETRLWWTFALDETIDKSLALPFNFHYDLEDYRFIKFMFYLQDINHLNGPHVCVKGSHKKKKLSNQFSFIRETEENKIFDYYGKEKVQTIYGNAGLGFVEDFYCFHRGTMPISKDRLILEVKFAMNDYGVQL